ncbi:MAG: hypothetical protein QXS00_06885 [Pyrobaculum sp.]
MEIVTLVPVGEETLAEIRQLIESMGPSPIDVVVVGAEETRLEPSDLYVLKISVPVDKYAVLKEVAYAHAVTDPQYAEVWAAPPELAADPLAQELSLALLRRLLDALVAKVDAGLVIERARPEIVESDTLLYTLVRTLAVDASASLAVSGRVAEALQLLSRLAGHPAYEAYRKFWDFVTSNFKFLPAYNWLLLMYGK